MGRIAEALKKAEQERAEQLRLHFGKALGEHTSSTTLLEGTADGVTQTAAEVGARRSVFSTGAVFPDAESEPKRVRYGSRAAMPSAPLTPAALSDGLLPPVLGPAPHWAVHPSIVAVHDHNSSITEQYRAVRTWLLRRAIGGEHSCIAVTSSLAKEGKTITVANLAAVMAEVRHLKILAVDADLRRGQLAALLQLPNSPGLADVITDRATLDEAIRKTPIGNLFVVPAGGCQDVNPAELVNSTALARVFEEFRERYDFVLVDTPPVQRLSDTGVIGALCTGILMVVRMNSTPAPVVQQSVSWLQSNNLTVVGCIATCCDARAAQPSYQNASAGND